MAIREAWRGAIYDSIFASLQLWFSVLPAAERVSKLKPQPLDLFGASEVLLVDFLPCCSRILLMRTAYTWVVSAY